VLIALVFSLGKKGMQQRSKISFFPKPEHKMPKEIKGQVPYTRDSM